MSKTQINTDLANFFDRASLAGWANESDGNVECDTGHFSLITVTEAEKSEYMDALADEDEMSLPVVGNWILVRDSDGNRELHSFDTEHEAYVAYRMLNKGYARWAAADAGDTSTQPRATSPVEPILAAPADTESGAWVDKLLNKHAERLRETYDKRLAGDHTFLGALAIFLTEYVEGKKEKDTEGSGEKMYLVCRCGEAFDVIDIAADHAETCGVQGGTDWSFDILPESEAL